MFASSLPWLGGASWTAVPSRGRTAGSEPCCTSQARSSSPPRLCVTKAIRRPGKVVMMQLIIASSCRTGSDGWPLTCARLPHGSIWL